MYRAILVPTDVHESEALVSQPEPSRSGDGSDPARGALDHAIDLAGQYGASLHVLFVVDTRAIPASPHADDVVAAIRAVGEAVTDEAVAVATRAGVECVGSIRAGVPASEVIDYAADHDVNLVVMGTHGRTDLRRYLLGSVAERVVRESPVPVLTVRGDGPDGGGPGTPAGRGA
ncbi:universal stress protein [Halomarina litorea]|uniref:universal stress protein n=1 Tax=Halomarina litorea TaxID=2961595 RepID=UPI0020C31711|nr:universal stress protein [Halomarina sp. BCD28]